jgi:hypothetical protein
VLYLATGDPGCAVDFDETPKGHAVSYDADGALVGLTLVDVRRLLEKADRGKLTIELPTVADSAELKLAVA